jgi:hypothetical protein
MYLLVWCCTDVFAGMMLYRCDVVQMFLSGVILHHHTSKNIYITPDKNICTTSHQQKHLYNITSHQERTSVAGVVLYRCFCWCDIAQKILLV